ncbi:MAG: hypothetical protein AAGL49_11425, partial [Pseudomonadota bacterium]
MDDKAGPDMNERLRLTGIVEDHPMRELVEAKQTALAEADALSEREAQSSHIWIYGAAGVAIVAWLLFWGYRLGLGLAQSARGEPAALDLGTVGVAALVVLVPLLIWLVALAFVRMLELSAVGEELALSARRLVQ